MYRCIERVHALCRALALCTLYARGLPPADLLDEVAEAWARAGLDVVECLRNATSVTNEWEYVPGQGDLHSRLARRQIRQRSIPIAHRCLEDVLSPQPRALVVIQKLLAWIDRVDHASQRGSARPAFATPDGGSIFPPNEDEWWLTDVRRKCQASILEADEDGPVTDVDDVQDDTDDEDSQSSSGSAGGEADVDAALTPVCCR